MPGFSTFSIICEFTLYSVVHIKEQSLYVLMYVLLRFHDQANSSLIIPSSDRLNPSSTLPPSF